MEHSRMGLRGWLAVSGVLILAAGSSLGFLAGTYFGKFGPNEAVFPEPERPEPTEILHVTNSRVYDLLGLNPDQRDRADLILSSYFHEMKSLQTEWDALGQKMEADLLGLLDAGQREQMREIIRQIRINEVAGTVSLKLALYRRELNLTMEQEDTLYPILLSSQLDKNEYYRDLHLRRARGENITHEVVWKRICSINEERDKKIRPFLTAEQFIGFKELVNRKRWGKQSSKKPVKKPAGEKSSQPGKIPQAD